MELRRFFSGLDCLVIWGWDLFSWLIIFRNFISLDWFLGFFFCSIVFIFLGLVSILLEFMMVFRNCIDGLENLYFFLFKVRLVFCNLWGVVLRCLLCLWIDLLKIRILFIWYRVFFVFFKFCEVSFWKCLGVELILKERWLKWEFVKWGDKCGKFCWFWR